LVFGTAPMSILTASKNSKNILVLAVIYDIRGNYFLTVGRFVVINNLNIPFPYPPPLSLSR
jgi:hypothetical protein